MDPEPRSPLRRAATRYGRSHVSLSGCNPSRRCSISVGKGKGVIEIVAGAKFARGRFPNVPPSEIVLWRRGGRHGIFASMLRRLEHLSGAVMLTAAANFLRGLAQLF